MNYLKSDEVTDYVTRVSVTSGKEVILSNIASRIIDAYCKRSLSLTYYFLEFDLNASLVGYVPYRPILKINPVDLTTGFRIRAQHRTIRGQRESTAEWADVTIPATLSDLLLKKTGRVEIASEIEVDYGRIYYIDKNAQTLRRDSWLAQIEVIAGHFFDTSLSASASIGATSLTVDSTNGMAVGSYLTVDDKKALYKITNITGSVLTISPGLAVAASSGAEVAEKIPTEVKMACAMVIEDRLTYEPNTTRQTETLDVITDRFVRADISPMPVDGQVLLQRYVN